MSKQKNKAEQPALDDFIPVSQSEGEQGKPSALLDFLPSLPPQQASIDLKSFWRFYNELVKDGWFERTYKTFESDEVPTSQQEYGKRLIKAVQKEPNIKRKYELYSALSILLDYLGGELNI